MVPVPGRAAVPPARSSRYPASAMNATMAVTLTSEKTVLDSTEGAHAERVNG